MEEAKQVNYEELFTGIADANKQWFNNLLKSYQPEQQADNVDTEATNCFPIFLAKFAIF